MIFNFKKHNSDLYNTLLYLSRNLFFYNKVKLLDKFETRIYLIFIHFSVILITFKKKKIKFPQESYDNLFNNIENNLRELGLGDVAVNKKMKDLNKIFYDILIKLNSSKESFTVNRDLVLNYFLEFNETNSEKYEFFDLYFTKFYHFCFEKHHDIVIKEAINFKVL
ncbi:MAG: ubiquinol-cytochrome C chaperone family protein [Candidatus Pelagibacter sp.]